MLFIIEEKASEEMKIIFRLVGILVGIILLWVSLVFSASELGGEVVTLLRPGQEGSFKKVRLWIVDDQDIAWIEHGTNKSFWINQLTHQSEISLIRGGVEEKYIAVPDLNSHDLYHQLRKEKYGIGERIIEITTFSSSKSCEGLPVRLKQI